MQFLGELRGCPRNFYRTYMQFVCKFGLSVGSIEPYVREELSVGPDVSD